MFHQRRAFFVEHRAVLDGVDTGAHRRFDAFGALRMRHHLAASAMGGLHDGAKLLVAQLLHVVVAERVGDAPRGHDLDPIGAVFEIVTHGHARLIGCVGDIRTGRQ